MIFFFIQDRPFSRFKGKSPRWATGPLNAKMEISPSVFFDLGCVFGMEPKFDISGG